MKVILLKLHGCSFILTILVQIASIGCAAPEVSEQIVGQAAPPEILNPVQMKEDIDFLVKTIKDSHPNPYAYVNRKDFKKAIEKTRQACETDMSIELFYRHAAWLAGQLKNGHTGVSPPKRWYDYIGKVFPLFWKLEEDKVRLHQGPYLDKRHWGATVLTINDKPALEVMRYYSSLWAKEAKDFDLTIGSKVKYLWQNMALDFGEDKLELELKNRNGLFERIVVKAVSIRDALKGQKTTTSPPVKWSPVTYSYRNDCQTGYINIRMFGDAAKFSEEIKNAFSDLKTKNAKNLIIDVRGCPGGTTLLSDELLGYLTDKEYTNWQKCKFRYSKLYQQQRGKHGFLIFTGSVRNVRPKPKKTTDNPLRFNGNLYVLIDGRTASTAVDLAGIVKYNKFGTLIGQETGGTMACYGDTLRFKLPNSQMDGTVACKYFEMPGTTKDNATQGVRPDHYVVNSLEDSWNKTDRAMEFVHELCSCDQM